MSIRPPVHDNDIERFLQELGRQAGTSGRIYLAGGAALVHAHVRGQSASTLDIDLALDVVDRSTVEDAIRRLKTMLGINVKLASPADFIPLPSSWQASSRYVGRYGQLDVFYFDFVSLALSKMARAQARDIEDVRLLARNGLIERAAVEAALQEIEPQLGHGPYFNSDPAQFMAQARAVIAEVWGQAPYTDD